MLSRFCSSSAGTLCSSPSTEPSENALSDGAEMLLTTPDILDLAFDIARELREPLSLSSLKTDRMQRASEQVHTGRGRRDGWEHRQRQPA